jgi:probable DNA metabolism protein
MQSLVYDSSFEGFLSAVFDVYYYKFNEADICPEPSFNGNLLQQAHTVHTDKTNSDRVYNALEKKLTRQALAQLHKTFLSELPGIENSLLQYIQYAISSNRVIETDFSNPAVLTITQTAKKVDREKHRMEAFVRFQKTSDDLYYAIIEPDYNVLPLISIQFEKRYADQRWLIYDGKRKYGIYYDLYQTTEVQINFCEETNKGKDTTAVWNEDEEMISNYGNNILKV